MYSTDNGPHMNRWPDGAMTPFRSEKNTNWEGAFRVPMLVRWPGKIKPGQISNEIVQHHDWFPTFLAMAGDPDVVEKLKKGYQAIGRTYKNHIDGFNLVPYLTGEAKESPRKLFVYLSDDGDVLGVRYDNWKVVFMEQRCPARCRSGRSRSPGSGCRNSSICAPIRMKEPIRLPTLTMTGSSITLTCYTPPGISWTNGPRPSRISRRSSIPTASPSTKR